MAEFEDVDIFSGVTLFDRTGTGGKQAEFCFAGIRFQFVNDDGDAVLERTVPKFVAEWLFSKQKEWVWTKPAPGQDRGEYVNRYAIKNCPKKIRETWGEHVADCSPIELDPDAIEGSDAPLYRTGPVRVVHVNIPPNERMRDRQGRAAQMVGPER